MLLGCAPDTSGSDASGSVARTTTQAGSRSSAGSNRTGLAGSGSSLPSAGVGNQPQALPNMGVGAGTGGMAAPPKNVTAGSAAQSVAGAAGSVANHSTPTAGSTAAVAGMPATAGGGGGAAGALAAAGGETGRQVGMTAAHNAVRAQVSSSIPLPPMVWSPALAAYAQQWADMLASSPSTCAMPMHRSGQELQSKGYGENLAQSGSRPARMTTPSFAVDGWAAEAKCWTYGTISDPLRGGGTEKCDTTCYMGLHSDGCGHYTQVIWRDSTQLGCGVSTCTADGITYDIWICNYAPPGNIIGKAPY